MRRITTIGLILCGALLASPLRQAPSAKPVVPRAVQLRILHATPALAYVPTRIGPRLPLRQLAEVAVEHGDHLRQQGRLGDPLRRPPDERIVPDGDGEELPARRQQGLLVAHRRRADGLALRHRPVRAGRCGSSPRARSRRPSSRTSASAASSRRASGSLRSVALRAAATTSGPDDRLKPVALRRLASGCRGNRRLSPLTTPRRRTTPARRRTVCPRRRRTARRGSASRGSSPGS